MRTQWTTKGNRDAGSSCLCNRGFHRYLRNFRGGGIWTPQTPPSRYATGNRYSKNTHYRKQQRNVPFITSPSKTAVMECAGDCRLSMR